MEIRMCSIEGARWLERLPEGGNVPALPKGLGLAFERAFARRIKECSDSLALRRSAAEGFILAPSGVAFESGDLVASVVHAVAAANVADGLGQQDEAYEIDRFVRGRQVDDALPKILRESGAVSFLKRERALELARWLRIVRSDSFGDEVADMHGRENVGTYRSIYEDLARVFESVSTHGADLCCVVARSTL